MLEEQLKMLDEIRYYDTMPEENILMLEDILEMNGYEFEPIELDEDYEQF